MQLVPVSLISIKVCQKKKTNKTDTLLNLLQSLVRKMLQIKCLTMLSVEKTTACDLVFLHLNIVDVKYNVF